jgi:mRNA-degrading endonuclease toxin of MazEF toxin-antitoxin module
VAAEAVAIHALQRPALIVSSSQFNAKHNDAVAITSKNPREPAPDEILLSHEEQQSAGLPKVSKVKSGKLISIDKKLVRKTLGAISLPMLGSIVDVAKNNLYTEKQ